MSGEGSPMKRGQVRDSIKSSSGSTKKNRKPRRGYSYNRLGSDEVLSSQESSISKRKAGENLHMHVSSHAGSHFSSFPSQVSKMSPKKHRSRQPKPMEPKQNTIEMIGRFKKGRQEIDRDNRARGYDWTDIFALRHDQMAFTR